MARPRPAPAGLAPPEAPAGRHHPSKGRVCRFLGVSPLVFTRPKEGFAGKYEAPMSADDRRFLLEFFEKEVSEVDSPPWLVLQRLALVSVMRRAGTIKRLPCLCDPFRPAAFESNGVETVLN